MPAGRPAGSSTKNKEALLKRLQDQYGDDFHPIMKMAKNAVVLQKIADSAAFKAVNIETNEVSDECAAECSTAAMDAITAWDKVAAYTEPKLKALEISTDPENPIGLQLIERVIVKPPDTDG